MRFRQRPRQALWTHGWLGLLLRVEELFAYFGAGEQGTKDLAVVWWASLTGRLALDDELKNGEGSLARIIIIF
jgi:hypothetical protein